MNVLIETLGWTLIHFLWEAGLIAVLLWVVLRVTRPTAAQVRYLAAGCAMLLMIASAAVTATLHWRVASSKIPAPPERTTTPPHAGVAGLETPVPPAPAHADQTPAAPAAGATAADGTYVPAPDLSGTPTLRQAIRPWLPWIVAFWAAGVATLSFGFLRSWLALRRLRAGARPAGADAATRIFGQLLERMHFRGPVALLTSAEAIVPMVVGWLKPAVIVPASLFCRLPAWQIEAILAHELAHVRRRDFLVNLLQNIVETIFFYHPAVWWVSAQLRNEREHCCDDAAAALCGGAVEYARALTALEEWREVAPAGALSATGGSLLHRVRRLLGVASREPAAVISWPVGIMLAAVVAALVLAPHFLHAAAGDNDSALPPAPPHSMARALLERWQALEETPSPLPEARVAGMRRAIDTWLAESTVAAGQAHSLRIYQRWHADRARHSADDLEKWLNAIAAVRVEPVQLALNKETGIGRILPPAERDALAFGPAGPHGLRAAWSLSPRRETYVFGDVVFATLTVWNTGDQTLITGNGRESPDLPLPLAITAFGESRRPLAIDQLAEFPNHPGGWRLKPGESAALVACRMKIGPGEPRETTGPLHLKPAPTHELRDPRSGEAVSMSASFPYPKTSDDPQSHPRIETGEIHFKVMAPGDMKVWTTNRAGFWPLAGGITLEVRQDVVHGADILTTAVLSWPDKRNAVIDVAADAFANRAPWAMAWESGQPVLWIASGALRSWKEASRESKPVATQLKRVDFSTPEWIVETRYSGWPRQGGPSAESLTALDALIEVPAASDPTYTYYQWATLNPPTRMAGSMNIPIYLDRDDGTFRLGTGGHHSLAELPALLRAESTRKLDQWQSWLGGMRPDQRAAMGEEARPRATIIAPSNLPFRVVTRVIEGCRAAGLEVTMTAAPEPAPTVRGVSLEGIPHVDDVTDIADLYESDPERPGNFRMKPGVFFMRLGEVNVGPWLYCAANSGEFYLSLRPDPAVIKDVIYGPIPGDPAARLDLRDWLGAQKQSTDPGYALRVVRDMIGSGDHSLARLAAEFMAKLGAPEKPESYASLIEAAHKALVEHPRSPVAAEMRTALAHVAAVTDAARKAWEASRKPLPDEQYAPGNPVTVEDPSVVWSEPDEKGLCLGISGIAPGSRWSIGSSVRFQLMLRNSGAEPVKFSWTPRIDDGFSARLRDESGFATEAEIISWSGLLVPHRTRLAPGELQVLKSAEFRIHAPPASDSPEARAAAENRFVVGPGRYTFEGRVHLSRLEFVPPAGEWIATLESRPIPVTIAPPDTANARQPGAGADAAPANAIDFRVLDSADGSPIPAFRAVAGVPSGVSNAFEKQHKLKVAVWQSHTLRTGVDGSLAWPLDRAYAEMAVRFEADGYGTVITDWIKKGDGAREVRVNLRRDPGVSGSVMTPENKRPAHDATVVLAMMRRNASLKGSTIPELNLAKADTPRDRWDRPIIVQPDAQGRFTLTTEPDPTAVVLILHGDGVFEAPFREWRQSPDVTLAPWGRIHGQVQWGDPVGAGEKIDLIVNRGDEYGYPDIIAQYASTTADDKGQFVFERVLPGLVQLSIPTETTADDGTQSTLYVEGRITHAEIRAPHTPVMMGGRGRTVTGRLTDRTNWEGVTFHFHPRAPHFGGPGDNAHWRAWSNFQNTPAGSQFFRSDLPVAPDGTFAIPRVLPGSYQIFFRAPQSKDHIASGQFHVPPEQRDLPPEPISAGEFKARTP